MPVTVIDANVFLHSWVRNTLLWVGTQGLFEPAWSKRLLREVYANLILKEFDDAAGVRHLHCQLKKAFPDAWLDESDIDDLIPHATNERKDRHVLAAAILASAETIVTYNIKDFPAPALEPHGLRARTPDDYLAELAELAPDLVCDALEHQRKVTILPQPWTMAELLGKLGGPTQLPKLSAQVSAHLGVQPVTPPRI